MEAKKKQREEAIALRKEGRSIIEIASALGVAKSSVYNWTKHIPKPERFTAEYREEKRVERQEKVRVEREKRRANFGRSTSNICRVVVRAPDGYKGKTHKKGRYVYEHRLIMEQYLGRLLTPDEVVHHINGDVLDNRLANLEVVDRRKHSSFHSAGRGRKFVLCVCPTCRVKFEKEKRKIYGRKFVACSRSCGNKFSYRIRREGMTLEIADLIANNILEEMLVRP